MAGEDIPSLTLAVLRDIRDEVKRTNERLDTLNERIDSTNERIDSTNANLKSLAQRQTETEVRLSTEIVAVATAVRELRDLLREDRLVRTKVDDHEKRIAALEKKAS